MDKIEIGAVAKPQGIKGELKIRLFCDGFDSVKAVTEAEIGGKVYAVESFRSSGAEEAILKLKGLDDRNQAELLRGKEVFAKRNEIKVEEGRYFVSDVLGCKLYLTSGKELGEIFDIVSGNVDYYYVKTSEGTAVFPLVEGVLESIDVAEKKVTVNAKRFTEVVMYED